MEILPQALAELQLFPNWVLHLNKGKRPKFTSSAGPCQGVRLVSLTKPREWQKVVLARGVRSQKSVAL